MTENNINTKRQGFANGIFGGIGLLVIMLQYSRSPGVFLEEIRRLKAAFGS